ncbi:hypothetical protein [Rubidibacter lacunae]|nr:hypothetical protein [Rubidibacter lacunae]
MTVDIAVFQRSPEGYLPVQYQIEFRAADTALRSASAVTSAIS